jgi:hypothetical protein
MIRMNRINNQMNTSPGYTQFPRHRMNSHSGNCRGRRRIRRRAAQIREPGGVRNRRSDQNHLCVQRFCGGTAFVATQPMRNSADDRSRSCSSSRTLGSKPCWKIATGTRKRSLASPSKSRSPRSRLKSLVAFTPRLRMSRRRWRNSRVPRRVFLRPRLHCALTVKRQPSRKHPGLWRRQQRGHLPRPGRVFLRLRVRWFRGCIPRGQW